MKYSTRIFVAALLSLMFNVAIWEVAARIVLASPVPDSIPEVSPPLVFTLSEPVPPPTLEQDEINQIIETVRESTEPIEETDLISDKNSKASDISDSEGERAAPSMDEQAEFDQQGGVPTEMVAAEEAAESSENPAVEEEMEVQEEVESAPQPRAGEVEEPTVETEQPIILTGELSEQPEESEQEPMEEETAETPEQEALPERFTVAQAETPKLQFQENIEVSKGRDDGGAEGHGFMSFEANKHEMGAYMLEVRTLVIRNWKASLLLKYHGVRRTKAVIECSIRPNGELEYVRIKSPGPSYSFAVICREAIRKAAPFPEFPFDVPEMYRNENLKITWNFSYL